MIRFGRLGSRTSAFIEVNGRFVPVKECPGRYYHATRFVNLEAIASHGLRLGTGSGLWGGSYRRHTTGRVFLAKGQDAALEWMSKILDMAEHRHGDDAEPDAVVPVLLRLRRLPRGVRTRHDKLGAEADFCSFYVTRPIPAEDLEAWDPVSGRWQDVGTVADRSARLGLSSIEAYDEDGDVIEDHDEAVSFGYFPFRGYEDGGFKPDREHPTAWR